MSDIYMPYSIEENQQCKNIKKQQQKNLFKEWMKKFLALLTKEKRPRMNGKIYLVKYK